MIDAIRLHAQRVQTHLGGGEVAGIELVRAQRRHERIDLRAHLRALGLIRIAEQLRTHQRRKQRDDGDHHQHFDQRDTALGSSSFCA